MVAINNLIFLAALLFSLGLVGVLLRRNFIMVFLAIELMLNSAILLLVSFSSFHSSLDGAMLAFIALFIIAVESVIGLALILLTNRLSRNIDVHKQKQLLA